MTGEVVVWEKPELRVRVSVIDGKIHIKTPYLPAFSDELKNKVKAKWNASEKAWVVEGGQEEAKIVLSVVKKYFDGLKRYLLLGFVRSGAMSVGGLAVVNYTRDWYKGVQNDIVKTINVTRFAECGSRRHPRFYGFVLAEVWLNDNIHVNIQPYRLFEYSAENLDALYKMPEKLTEQFKEKFSGLRFKLTDELLKEIEEALKGIKVKSGGMEKEGKAVEVAEEVVAVRGFLVVSTLPSTALLDQHLPEIFKNEKVGVKEIKVVRGWFYNRLNTLARRFYCSILPRYAVNAGFGYIVPATKVKGFVEEVEKLKKDYEKYEEQLRAFIERGEVPEKLDNRAIVEPEYLELVREYIRQVVKEIEGEEKDVEIRVPRIAERVRVRLIPFSLDVGLVRDYLDAEVVERIQNEIYETKKEMVEAARKEIDEKLRGIYERLKAYEERKLKKQTVRALRRDIEDVIETARGLEMDIEGMERLKAIAEALEAEEVAEGAAVQEAEGRVRALLKEVLGE